MSGFPDGAFEFIFLGTGTSSSIPQVDCLTAPHDREPCRTCLSASTGGSKDRRRNTSAVVRTEDQDGDPVTIVIDAGKTFQAAAVEWFPRYGLRKIDALLITHSHADAMNGLDDLRGWTLKGAIQDHVDVYVSHSTFLEVERSFPYMVSKKFASGGGDVPAFIWHIIKDSVPFEIGTTGIMVTPFNVEHGRIYSTPPSIQGQDAPDANGDDNTRPGQHQHEPHAQSIVETPIIPLHCFGFRFGAQLAYVSDVSAVPTAAWAHLRPAPTVLVLDCLRSEPHTSHFGIKQAVACAREVGAPKTLLIGFNHEMMHEEWERVMPAAEGIQYGDRELGEMREVARQAVALVEEGSQAWIRPAFDGMRLWIENGEVRIEDT